MLLHSVMDEGLGISKGTASGQKQHTKHQKTGTNTLLQAHRGSLISEAGIISKPNDFHALTWPCPHLPLSDDTHTRTHTHTHCSSPFLAAHFLSASSCCCALACRSASFLLLRSRFLMDRCSCGSNTQRQQQVVMDRNPLTPGEQGTKDGPHILLTLRDGPLLLHQHKRQQVYCFRCTTAAQQLVFSKTAQQAEFPSVLISTTGSDDVCNVWYERPRVHLA